MATEADTCRTLITPELQTADWDADPHSIAEQPRNVSESDPLEVEADGLKRLQAETAI